MTLKEYIKNYMDSDNLVALNPTVPGQVNASGNGLLYTSLYYMCLSLRNELDESDHFDFDYLIRTCEREPGLLMRGPHHGDQEGPDDYLGVTAASLLLSLPNIPAKIVAYGNHRYIYNNVQPGTYYHPDGRFNWSAMFWRMPQVIAHFHHTNRSKPTLFHRIYWALAVMYSTKEPASNQDAWMLSYLLVSAHDDRSWICRQVFKLWNKKRKAKGIAVKDIVMRVMGPMHPVTLYWPEVL